MIVAQISDPHVVEHGELLFDRIPTNAHLEAAVRCLASLDPRPDLVVVTGDLVNEGRPAQYRELRRLLEPLAMPVRLMCGNHDDPVGLREVFADHGYLGSEGPIDYVVDDVVPLRIVALDTHVPGEPGGHLTATQLAWLDARLGEAADRPCLVALHHPPFATGIAHMDEMGLTEAATEGLRDVVSRHPQVERVICGHLHRTIARRFAGTVATTVPSTAHAVALDLRPELTEGASNAEPPAITLHLWRAGIGLVTHTRTIGDFPGHLFGPPEH
ncbi:MAG: phosphodiesterase [Acidimicrobiaceae bacterium]|nr:phosphodiesterase [Acidimicrobiaceae bacterium]